MPAFQASDVSSILTTRTTDEPLEKPELSDFFFVRNIWLGEKESNLQILGSKPSDFTNLSTSDYMATSHGLEPWLLVPETSVLPLDDKVIKNTASCGAHEHFVWVKLSSRKLRWKDLLLLEKLYHEDDYTTLSIVCIHSLVLTSPTILHQRSIKSVNSFSFLLL